jgi:hypothetical protein
VKVYGAGRRYNEERKKPRMTRINTNEETREFLVRREERWNVVVRILLYIFILVDLTVFLARNLAIYGIRLAGAEVKEVERFNLICLAGLMAGGGLLVWVILKESKKSKLGGWPEEPPGKEATNEEKRVNHEEHEEHEGKRRGDF